MGEYKSSYAGSKIDELLSYIDQDRLLSKDGGTITGNLTVGGNAVDLVKNPKKVIFIIYFVIKYLPNQNDYAII